MNFLNQEKGFTLVELLVTILIASVTVAAIFQVMYSSMHSANVENSQVDLVQNSRIAMDHVVDAVRDAAYIYPDAVASAINLPSSGPWLNGPNRQIVLLLPCRAQTSAPVGGNAVWLPVVEDPRNSFRAGDQVRIGTDTYNVGNVTQNGITLNGNTPTFRSYNANETILNLTRCDVRAYLFKTRASMVGGGTIQADGLNDPTALLLYEYRNNGGVLWNNGALSAVDAQGAGVPQLLADYMDSRYNGGGLALITATTSAPPPINRINGLNIQIVSAKKVSGSSGIQRSSLQSFAYANNVR